MTARDFKTDITINGKEVLTEADTKEMLAVIIALLDEQNNLLIEIGRPTGTASKRAV